MTPTATTMEYVPFMVLSERRRAAIAAVLRQVLEDVVGGDMPVTVSLLSECKQPVAEDCKGRVWTLHSPGSDAAAGHCFISEGFLRSLLVGNAPSGREPKPESLAALLQEAVHEVMCSRLASAWKVKAACSSSAVSFRDMAQPHMNRWVACAIGSDSPAVVLLHPSLIERCVPEVLPQQSMRERVVKRVQAIRGNDVNVDVVLGEAEVTCADLAKLSVGDVLVVNRELSAPIEVMTADGRVVGSVRVGRVDERLAVQWV